MELSEVVNPHFAFPVVGVVLFAFLVFAFGFKSSVQPPSFDNLEEEKKPRKTKTKKKAHVPEIVDSASQKVVNHKTSTVINKALEKSPQASMENKSKVKKSPVPLNKKSEKAQDVKKAEKIPKEAQEEGGWVSISKKKKNKGKKESEEIDTKDKTSMKPKVALRVYNEPVIGDNQHDILIDELELPQPQRAKKDKAGKGKSINKPDSNDKENIPETNKIEPKPEETKKSDKKGKSKIAGSEENSAEAGISTEKIVKKKGKKSKAIEVSDADIQIKDAEVEDKDFIKVSAKRDNKKNKSPEPVEIVEQVTSNTTDNKSINKKAAPDEDTSHQNKPEVTSYTTDNKSTNKKAALDKDTSHQNKPEVASNTTDNKSKNKKTAPDEDTSHQNKPEVAVSQSKVQSEPTTENSQKTKKKKEPEQPPAVELENCIAAAAESSTVNTSQASSSQAKSNPSVSVPEPSENTDSAVNVISFDELGDWQDAKPAKKRKPKARREN